MISHKAKYALRALTLLARAGGPVVVSEIAERQRIPKKFLEQILLDLKRHGLIASRRGRLGGYELLKSADSLTISEVLRVMDGPIAPLACLSRVAYRRCADCRDEVGCEVRRLFAVVAESTRAILDRATLADMLAGPDPDLGIAEALSDQAVP